MVKINEISTILVSGPAKDKKELILKLGLSHGIKGLPFHIVDLKHFDKIIDIIVCNDRTYRFRDIDTSYIPDVKFELPKDEKKIIKHIKDWCK